MKEYSMREILTETIKNIEDFPEIMDYSNLSEKDLALILANSLYLMDRDMRLEGSGLSDKLKDISDSIFDKPMSDLGIQVEALDKMYDEYIELANEISKEYVKMHIEGSVIVGKTVNNGPRMECDCCKDPIGPGWVYYLTESKYPDGYKQVCHRCLMHWLHWLRTFTGRTENKNNEED